MSSARVKRWLLFGAGASLVGACILSTTVRGRSLTFARGQTVRVQSPLKVHLRDGSVVVFRDGATVRDDSIAGNGVRYSVALAGHEQTSAIPLDSVLGAETFRNELNPGRTLAYTLGATALTITAIVGIKALFGSCPTIYSDSAGTPVLDAESFSYSIAPLLAKRDLDRLRAQPDSTGVLRLEVRNEALETHYIDQLELIEVRAREGEEVFPEPHGDPVAIALLAPPVSARDRAGRDLRRILAAVDQSVFSTSEATLAHAIDAGGTDTETDATQDWIDLAIPRAGVGDSLAIALTMRSSLLTTVLFYDYMLARPGARSLDWMASDLARITTLAKLARWYTGKLGLRIAVRDGDGWRQTARLADFGPIAWRNVAVVVPARSAPGDDSVRVRLSFLADQWRIDRVAISPVVRRLAQRRIPLARVRTPAGEERRAVRDALVRADASQLSTEPGDRFVAEFDVGKPLLAADERRTFFLAAQGYYVEWVRGAWLQTPRDSMAFDPQHASTADLLRSWRSAKDSLEARFFAARVPVQ